MAFLRGVLTIGLASCKILANTQNDSAALGAASPTAPRRAEATERPAAAAAAPTPPARPRSGAGSHAERHGVSDGPPRRQDLPQGHEDVPEFR